MSRLSHLLKQKINPTLKIMEADEEAPEETDATTDASDDTTPVDGTEDIPLDDTGDDAQNDTNTDDMKDTENTDATDDTTISNDTMDSVTALEDPDAEIDKNIEQMIGITDIQHTSSSTIIDFEDGGQLMYVQPMVSLKSETLNEIIALIIKDVKKTYSVQKDEITGKELSKSKYWKSVNTLIETMVRSQLTKSDNLDGLIDEIKQVFKILEVK